MLFRFFIVLSALTATLVVVFGASPVLAQESGPVGELVVAPQDLEVGERAQAVGFHVSPDDLEVRITYDTAYLVPVGDSCSAGSARGRSPAATSSLAVMLSACSPGTTFVQLVVSDTGVIIDEVDVVITEASEVAGAAESDPSISLHDVPASLKVGESDTVTVRVEDLDRTVSYTLITVPLNDRSLLFHSSCDEDNDDHDDRTESISRTTFSSFKYKIWACSSPGTVLWSRLKIGNRIVAATSIDDYRVQVLPTVSFSSRSFSGDEGEDITVTVNLNGARGESPDIPIETENISAEDRDYGLGRLNSDGELEFSTGDTSKSFLVRTNEDNQDCSNEQLTVSFGDLPEGIAEGSPASATVTIYDDEDEDECPSGPTPRVFYATYRYFVDEGDYTSIKVMVNRGGPRSDVDIPITWESGPGTDDTDYRVADLEPGNTIEIDKGDSYKTFTFHANEDDDCRNESVTLGFGRLPGGVERGGQDTTEVIINDNDSRCGDTEVSFGSSSYSVTEGATTTITVRMSRTEAADKLIPITWENRSADDTDYSVLDLEPSNYLKVLAGDTSAKFRVRAEEDNDDCQVNTVLFTIDDSLPSGLARKSPYSATLTINEPPANCLPSVALSASATSIDEGGTVTFTITKTGGPAASLRVALNSTTTGDFFDTIPPRRVTIGASTSTATFDVVTLADDEDEDNGRVEVSIATSTAYNVSGSGYRSVTIRDDDNPTSTRPTVSISASHTSITEGGIIKFTVSRTGSTAASLTVGLSSTTTGSFFLTYPLDEVVIAKDSARKSFNVQTDDDGNYEPGGGSVVVSIDDNDTLYSIGTKSVKVFVDDNDRPRPPSGPTGVSWVPTKTRGSVKFSWTRSSRADRYEVRECTSPETCSTSIRSARTRGTTATVAGLDPDDLYRFVVRAINAGGSGDSVIVGVNLKPAPQNLEGAYNTGEHRRVTLKWDPVPNLDVADDVAGSYTVEQHIHGNWVELTDDISDNAGVTVGRIFKSGNKITTTVYNLIPSTIEYRHRVKATSVQGTSDASAEVSTEVVDESPIVAPSGLNVGNAIGLRGASVWWMANVPGAETYLIRANPNTKGLGVLSYNSNIAVSTTTTEWARVTTSLTANVFVRVYGLVPGTDYTFEVKASNGSGDGPEATTASYTAERPYSPGHQSDHKVSYTKGPIDDDYIRDSLSGAAARWTRAARVLDKDIDQLRAIYFSHEKHK